MHRPLILIGCICASSAAAEPVQMTGESIKATFSGSRLDLDTPAGTTIPVRFSDDGMVSGESGVLAAVLGSSKDRGRWWTEGDKLCLKWFRWFDAKRRCIDLKQDGARIFWRDQSGETGTGTLADRPQVAEKPAAMPTPYALGAVEVAKKQPPKVAAAHASTKQAPEPQVANVPAPEAAPAQQPAEEPAANPQPTPVQVAAAMPPANEDTGSSDVPRMRFADMSVMTAATSATPEETSSAQPQTGAAANDASVPQPTPVKKKAAAPSPAPKKPEPAAKKAAKVATPAAADKRHAEKAPTARAAVAPAAKPAPAPTTPTVELFKVAGVVEGDILNVRSGPSEYHAPVGSIAPEGRGVKITGPCLDQWCPIRYGRVSGWVNRAYLVAETAVSSAPAVASRSAR